MASLHLLFLFKGVHGCYLVSQDKHIGHIIISNSISVCQSELYRSVIRMDFQVLLISHLTCLLVDIAVCQSCWIVYNWRQLFPGTLELWTLNLLCQLSWMVCQLSNTVIVSPQENLVLGVLKAWCNQLTTSVCCHKQWTSTTRYLLTTLTAFLRKQHYD